jgi:ADP-ribosylglycohydrolase
VNQAVQERIYAGVLGKIIGVYLGRPVEGWPYEKIDAAFGEVLYYVNDQLKVPLIVPDDDISGTFAFIRALGDNGCPLDLSSKVVGESWLNYIIEDKTILWWGGLSRSTEHTAFLRLKSGVDAPMSGSIAMNGESMATQIGAEIFIDSWALVCPGNPELAARFAREAASVSHDGIAVEAAVYLAVMEAMAFNESRLDRLMAEGLRYVRDDQLKRLISEIQNVCAKSKTWRDARSYIAEHHGYDKYLGNCPMVTNHLTVLMALILGGESFQNSISIAVSSGWDTDCNAGNVGCLNGIRLGLAGIDDGADFRGPVADRLLVVTADGGSCISDAVIETRKLVDMATALEGEPASQALKIPRFSFEYPGSLQGFMLDSRAGLSQGITSISNARSTLGMDGLRRDYAHLGPGMIARTSVETYTDLCPMGREGTSYFEVLASPSLYGTQWITAEIQGMGGENPEAALFVEYYTDSELVYARGEFCILEREPVVLRWQVPDTNGFPVYRAGIELRARQCLRGTVVLRSMDWRGAPEHFVLGKSYIMSPSLTPWTTDTIWLKSFMSSAKNFYPDYTTTFSISHPEENGVVTIGSRDWDNYTLTSTITFMKQKQAGLVVRSQGHRRYYGAIIEGAWARIILRRDRECRTLAEVDGSYTIDSRHELSLKVQGNLLVMSIDGKRILEAVDNTYISGAAGFLVDTGAILVDGMCVTACGKG